MFAQQDPTSRAAAVITMVLVGLLLMTGAFKGHRAALLVQNSEAT